MRQPRLHPQAARGADRAQYGDGPQDRYARLVERGAICPRHTFCAEPNTDKCPQLGAHYKTAEDILLIAEPVIMAPLDTLLEITLSGYEPRARM